MIPLRGRFSILGSAICRRKFLWLCGSVSAGQGTINTNAGELSQKRKNNVMPAEKYFPISNANRRSHQRKRLPFCFQGIILPALSGRYLLALLTQIGRPLNPLESHHVPRKSNLW